MSVTGGNLVADARGVRFDVATPWGNARVASPLSGRFNASNLLGTLAVLLVSGITLRKAIKSLNSLAPVAGRMQTAGGGTRPLVVVDAGKGHENYQDAKGVRRRFSDIEAARTALRGYAA